MGEKGKEKYLGPDFVLLPMNYISLSAFKGEDFPSITGKA